MSSILLSVVSPLDDLSTTILSLLLAWNWVPSDKVVEQEIWDTASHFLVSPMWISFFYIKSFASTLWNQGNPGKKLIFGFSLDVTNAHITCSILKTSTQNLTQVRSFVDSPFAIDILRRWLARVFVGLTLSPNLLISLGLMITRSDL